MVFRGDLRLSWLVVFVMCALDGGDNGPWFYYRPSVVLCGYGCLPALPGMIFTLIKIIWGFGTFSAASAYMRNPVL